MDKNKKWTDLSVKEISDLLKKAGYPEAGEHVVKGLLRDHEFKKLKQRKVLITGSVDPSDRNCQFENIGNLRNAFIARSMPVIAVDTKKKEFLGTIYREGHLYTQEGQRVYDHDFPYLADGKAIPQVIFDYALNKGFVNIGTSAETPAFICDSIARWWHWMGKYDYPEANEVMITLDAGGSSGVRCNLFKEKLAGLVDRIGIPIRIAHYPPYTSKWHPIEHRVFPHITRALSGVILDSFETVKQLIEKTTTRTGLWVRAHILDRIYRKGDKCSPQWNEASDERIIRDEVLPQWNYTVIPA